MSNQNRQVPGMTLHNDSNGIRRFVGEANGKTHEITLDKAGNWKLSELIRVDEDESETRQLLSGAVDGVGKLYLALKQLGYTATEGK